MSSSLLVPHLRPLHDDPNDTSNVISANPDTFEIEDFTSASDWEKFAASLERILRDWVPQKNGAGDRSSWTWKQERKSLTFHDFDFAVTRHTLVDPACKESESAPKAEHDAAHDDSESETDENEDGSPRATIPDCLVEMMDPNLGDFPFGGLPIHYFYGLTDFVILSPLSSKEQVDNSTRLNVNFLQNT